MVLTYRSEAIINQHGIEGLLGSMRKRLAASA
jgi:hypothetical protein